MYQKERTEQILRILQKNGYVTVRYLTEELHYSTATVNRDLNLLAGQKLVRRTYGGVELAKITAVPLPFRYHQMKTVKHHMARLAAAKIEDGETVFIDGSTTTQGIGQFLVGRKIRVISNNMALVSFLADSGVEAICLGGKVSEAPSMLDGPDTVENAMRYRADRMFFASGGFTDDGEISGDELYYLLHHAMAARSAWVCYMADHEKRGRLTSKVTFTFSDMDCVISDYDFPADLRAKYPDTEFVTADE